MIRFGFADRVLEISDASHFWLDGYGFRLKPAEAVRDQLHVKVCAIVSDTDTFLLYSLDIIGLRAQTYRLVTDQITAITGIPKEKMALCCTHTHAAPATGLLDELPVNYDFFGLMGEVCGRIANEAIERACPCKVKFEILPEQLIHSYNRRGRDPIDRRIRAAAFRDEAGKLKGVLCTAACHAVNNKAYTISADWLAELNKVSTDDVPYMYFQGRGADINPHFDDAVSYDERIEVLGSELVGPVTKYAENAVCDKICDGELKMAYEYITLPMLAMRDADKLRASLKEYEQKHFELPYGEPTKHYHFREIQWLRHMLRLCESGESNDFAVPLSCMAVGNSFVFAFVPFELLTLTGNKLEEVFVAAGYPREAIYICGYTNVTEGYLAPVEEFAYGGYEVVNAAHWYNISQNSPETEPAVIEWFGNQAK